MEKKSDFTIGLIGNPGVGKTRLFGVLTGGKQTVGKTLEKGEGELVFEGRGIRVVDLPGTYGLNAYTQDEAITTDFIFEEKAEAVLQIIDARNLERNLLMTIHLIEMGAPLVIAINLLDLAQARGVTIDIEKLSVLLGVPVVGINVKKQQGIEELLRAVLDRKQNYKDTEKRISYGEEIEEELAKLRKIIGRDGSLSSARTDWLALSFLEGGATAQTLLGKKPYFEELEKARTRSVAHLENVLGKDLGTIFARLRYGFVDGLCEECVEREEGAGKKSLAEKLDDVALDRFLGIPLFLVVILAVFQLSFQLARPVALLIENIFHLLGASVTAFLFARGFSAWTVSLLVDGVIGGVGNVLVFVPILGMLFILLAILEDCGYMARIAYVMDGFMHKLGLHGKASVPMILGFGCNVPGIMATRNLENKRDRLLSILINPFMSCGSRLPTYILFAGIFFPDQQGIVIFSLYALGLVMAIAVGYVFRKFVFRELSAPFVIELPAYSLPNWKGVLIHGGEKVWLFIKNAGTLIMAFSVLIWFLASLPMGVTYGSAGSLAGSFGRMVSPLFAPLGFGNWQAAVALIFGLAGKEIIVGTFGTLYGAGAAGGGSALHLASALRQDFTPLTAYVFMVFVLFYTPCIATLSTIKRETGSWRWMVFVATYSVVIAWFVAFALYQTGRYLGL